MYNLLFVLTAGGRLNYAGTRQWLDQLDQRLLASIQFALCLDSLVLSPDQRLYLHISRPPKDLKIRLLFDVIIFFFYLPILLLSCMFLPLSH